MLQAVAYMQLTVTIVTKT